MGGDVAGIVKCMSYARFAFCLPGSWSCAALLWKPEDVAVRTIR